MDQTHDQRLTLISYKASRKFVLNRRSECFGASDKSGVLVQSIPDTEILERAWS